MRSLVDRGCRRPEKIKRGDAARSDSESSGSRSVRDRSRVHSAGRLGSSFQILAPSDDRRIHGCGPEIPADSSARVQTPASALVHGSLDVPSKIGCLSLRFGFRRLVSNPDVSVAPGRPGSTFWARIRSAHAGRPPSSARKPASRTGRRARPGNICSTALAATEFPTTEYAHPVRCDAPARVGNSAAAPGAALQSRPDRRPESGRFAP